MTKTLIIGDLHLQAGVIIPLIKDQLESKHIDIDKIILIGDYFDQWKQTNNKQLYIKECNFLKKLIMHCKDRGIKIEFILGNHDTPYICNALERYSIWDDSTHAIIRDCINEMQPKLATNMNGFLISHAGLIKNNVEIDKTFDINNASDVSKIFMVNDIYDSCVWIRPDMLKETDIENTQIIGHTPVETVTFYENMILIDTFSLMRDLRPIGDGSFIIHDSETNEINIERVPNWSTITETLIEYFTKKIESV